MADSEADCRQEGWIGRPTVSIVIPAHNVEDFLSDTVESVLAQSFETWELVIVDDGSTDTTGSIADEYSQSDRRIRVVHQPNGGVSRARNAGLGAIDRDTTAVIFLDSDDIWEQDALLSLWIALERESNAVAVYGFSRHFADGSQARPSNIEDADGRRPRAVDGCRRTRVSSGAPATFEVLCLWPCIKTGGQILIRLTAIHEVEPFEPDILSQDWLFWLRLSLRGRIQPVDHFVLRKREREGSLMRRPEFRKAELTVRRLLVGGPEMTPSRVRTARTGHKYAVLERLSWSRTALAEGRMIDSLRQLRRCFIAAIGYTRMGRLYANRIDELKRSRTGARPGSS